MDHHRSSGRSNGFGFVSYNNSESARRAIEGRDGYKISSNLLKVQLKDQSALGGMRGGGSGKLSPPSPSLLSTLSTLEHGGPATATPIDAYMKPIKVKDPALTVMKMMKKNQAVAADELPPLRFN